MCVSPLAGGLVDPTTIVLVENGKRVNRSRDDVRITTSLGRVVWNPLRRNGKWNRKVRQALKGKAGVYAIRVRGAKKALYVGEAGKRRGAPHLHSKDPDRMMRTILRHFQSGFTPEKYATGEATGGRRSRRRDARKSHEIAYARSVESGRFEGYRAGGREWVFHDPDDLDVALYITPPGEAVHHEGRWIAKLVPLEQGEFVGEEIPF